MIIPSMTEWGLPSRTARSMKAPGSPSSALQMTYFGSPFAFRQVSHFLPAGNPPPPRPRKPEALISSMISSGDMVVSAFAAAA